MYIPSISNILVGVFLAYVSHSIWIAAQLFVTLKCTGTPCYTSFLEAKPSPRMQLALFTSAKENPIASEVKELYRTKNFDYRKPFEQQFEVDVPLKTRRNGTMYMHVVLALEGEPLDWKLLRRDGPTIIHRVPITNYIIPEAETFHLLQDAKDSSKKPATKQIKPPVTHIMSNVYINLLTDSISISQEDVPPELARLIHVNKYRQILPILKADFFNTRFKDLVQVVKNTMKTNINFHFKPIGIGKLRLMLIIEQAMQMIEVMGFSKKDIDEVKGLFSDTNLYLLCVTMFVASLHTLFDFLSFKNDISFWRNIKSYEGLSTRTTLWRAFSQTIIFLYLYDSNTSMLVLVPAGLGLLIEFWKCKKILKINIKGLFSNQRTDSTNTQHKNINLAEKVTKQYDQEGMKYLSYLLYPLCIAGAAYSLLYQPHKSWYSWTLNSLVNGVYAFGFLFMLPQLFINYKLKSVAALPWRAFMYKAFNTFIDDFFAFIITMPTAHRVACLRDDIVFIIYLYQRYLYPVDKNRKDMDIPIETENDAEKKKLN